MIKYETVYALHISFKHSNMVLKYISGNTMGNSGILMSVYVLSAPSNAVCLASDVGEVVESGINHIASGSHFLVCLTEIFRCLPVCIHSSTRVCLLGREITLYQDGDHFIVNLSLTWIFMHTRSPILKMLGSSESLYSHSFLYFNIRLRAICHSVLQFWKN